MKAKLGLKRWICLLLCILLLIPSYAFAQSTPANADIKGHWAEKQISDWLSKGYVSVYNDGSFKPNTGITRAELASVVNKAFGFTEKDETNFKDVNPKDSFYNDMAIAKKAGYLKGNEKGNGTPNAFMSRQEFAVIIQRLMKLEEPSSFKAINVFKDASSIPSWSKAAIESVAAKGYMIGDAAKAFNPKGNVTRAEAIVTLDRSYLHFIRAAYDKAGTYQAGTINGSVAINVPDVILENATVNGDLIIGKGVGEGNVTLKNVTIKGDTIVKGGGMNSIVVENCTLGPIVISKEGNMVRVVAVGSTTTGNVEMQSGGKLETSGTSSGGFGHVTIAETVDTGAPILLVGNFESIEVQATGIKLDVASGSVGSIAIAPTAVNTNLNIGAGTKVTSLTLAAPTTVAGTGTVATATVQGNNVTLGVTGTTTIAQLEVAATAQNSSVSLGEGTKVTNMKVDSAAAVTGTGTIGTAQVNAPGATITAPTETLKTAPGVTVTAPPTPPAPPVTPPATGGGNNGGSNDNGNTNVAVTAITVTSAGNAATVATDNGTLQMSAAIAPSNATNKAVTWSVINGTGTASISNTGLLRAISNGTVTVKATANDGSGKYGTKTITLSNQLPTVLFSATRIASGAVNPDIVVNVDNDTFTASGVSAIAGSWTTSLGTTGLTIGSITRNSNTQITFHMNGTAQAGSLTLKAKAAALAGDAESNSITVFVLPVTSGNVGTIEAATDTDGIVDEQPTIAGQNITFNGKVEYYRANSSNHLPKSANWVGVKITAPEGITPDSTAVLYVNGRNINYEEQPGWENIQQEGDGENYFHLYQRVIDLSRKYNITIKWNNSLTESYMITFAETATLEAPHGSIERAEQPNGGPNATTVIEGRSIRFNGEIEYLIPNEWNNVPFQGNWVGVKITAPEGVYPDENAVLTAHGQNCNRDGKPGWENIREEGDGDNYFYLYQRVRQTGYVYEIEIKWNNDVTETYEIIISGSGRATLEVFKTDLQNMIHDAQDLRSHALEYGTISQEALNALDEAIEAAQTVYDEAVDARNDTVQSGVYAAQDQLIAAIEAFWDAYETIVMALPGNMLPETTYTDEEPLRVTLELTNGIGDFNTEESDYITLDGDLAAMSIKTVSFEGEPARRAIIELTGTTGSSIENCNIFVAEGGVNGHKHGFDAVWASGTIERAEEFNGGENAVVTVDGKQIRFAGELEYYVADENNGLPISGNFVGVRITAPEGVMPDETATLTAHGQLCNNDGQPGWDNIRGEGDGDNYFYLYQRVRQTGYVYEIVIKWNKDLTETYWILVPGAATLGVYKTDLENMIAAAQGLQNHVQEAGIISQEAIDALGEAIESAQTVYDSAVDAKTDAVQSGVYTAQEDLGTAMDEILNAYKSALTAMLDAEYPDRTSYTLHEEEYTPESWAAYTQAITAAMAVEEGQGATIEDIEAAISAINEAKGNLTPAE